MCYENCETKTITDIIRELRAAPMTGENVAYLPRGDTKIPYIPWKVGAEALDSICCRWMWDIKETRLDAGGWTVTGRLTLVSADGEMHHKEATGYPDDMGCPQQPFQASKGYAC